MMFVKEQENEITTDITLLINDYNLYKQGKDLFTQLKPLSKRLNFQRDFATVDFYNLWIILLKEETLKSHCQLIKKRVVQVSKPFHYLAYFMHPVCKEDNLTTEHAEIARN